MPDPETTTNVTRSTETRACRKAALVAKESLFGRLTRRVFPQHIPVRIRLVLVVAIVIGVSLVGVLGYSYATGGNPFAGHFASSGTSGKYSGPGDDKDPNMPGIDSEGSQNGAPYDDPQEALPGDFETNNQVPAPIQGGPVKAHGLYLTSWVAGIPSRVESLVEHISSTNMNAMVIDVKDNTGTIAGPIENLKIAEEIGALSKRVGDLPGLVQSLAKRGVYPIARIVVFQDPVLAKAKPEWAIRYKDGTAWKDADGNYWANPYRKEVWDYNISIAKEAARMGFSEIQFDYVRFPDNRKGARTNAVIDNPDGISQADAIESFLKYAMEELKPLNVFVSADVFAFTATAQGDLGIGQDFRKIAGVVDYICPMVYPSHYYNPGIYGFQDPEAHPYEVAKHSLLDAIERSKGQRAIIRPWLQDFSLRHKYGPKEVAAQIQAARELGIDEWLLWNPANVYTAGVDYGLEDVGIPVQNPPSSTNQPGENSTRSRLSEGNELGKVMILEYHEISHEEERRWSKPAAMFRQDLERLYSEGYRAVSLENFLNGSINLPKGLSPVIITFDDSTPGQLRFLETSSVNDPGAPEERGETVPEADPNSAVGILKDFAKQHPDFGLEATFYVLFPNPFGNPGTAEAKLKYLVDSGLDIGNHTYNHLDLRKATSQEIEKDLGMATKAILEATGGYVPTTLSLPYGSFPSDPAKAKKGQFEDTKYSNKTFLLVGAEPALPPLRKGYDPYKLPRVQATSQELDKWLAYFKSHPEERYVSDGDTSTVTIHPDLIDRFDRKSVPLEKIRASPRPGPE